MGRPFTVADAYAGQRMPVLTFGFAPNNFLMEWSVDRNEDIKSQNPFKDDVYGRVAD